MAFYNRLSSVLKQSISQGSASSYMMNSIRCMSTAQSKLFIGGLSFNTDDNSLKDAFSSFGEVVEASVVMDRNTGRSRGFGFVNFSDSESASQAIADMDGQDLQGRTIRVTFAQDQREPPTSGLYDVGGGYGGCGGGYSDGGGYGGSGGYQAIADMDDQELHGRTIRVNYAHERQPRTGGYDGDGGEFNDSDWGYCVATPSWGDGGGGPIYNGSVSGGDDRAGGGGGYQSGGYQAIADMDGQDLQGRTIRVSYAQERQPRTGGYGGSNGFSDCEYGGSSGFSDCEYGYCVRAPIFGGSGSGGGYRKAGYGEY